MNWTDLHPLILEAGRTTLAVGFLAVLVLVIRRPFARQFGAKAAYALWLLPLARFVTPPLPGNWSLTGWLGFGPQAETIAPIQIIPRASEMLVSPAPVTMPVQPLAGLPDASLVDVVLTQMPLILISVWIGGIALWLARSVYQQSVFTRLIETDSEPASAAVLAEASLVARQLGLKRMPEIRTGLLCSGPLVTGLTRPVVLLPLWFEADYTRAEQRDAMVHELTHLKRRDLWSFQLARIVGATQWFNPLAHLALRAFRSDQEAACDADVLAQDTISPAAYGRTLVKAARLSRPSDRRIAVLSLTLAHPIKERLEMMQHPAPTRRSRLTGTALVALIGGAAIFTTASCMSAQAEEKETKTFVFTSGDYDGDNRQMVLLSDPFAELHPKLSAVGGMDFSRMQSKLDIELEGLDADIAELVINLDSFMGLENFSEFGEEFSFSTDGEDGHNVLVLKSGEQIDDFELRIEERVEQFEEKAKRLEEKAEDMEQRSEIITALVNSKLSEMADQREARAEPWAAKFEAAFDDNLAIEARAAGAAVVSLSQQCDARSADETVPEIVSTVNAQTGETYRAVCVNGDREALGTAALADWIAARDDLSAAEKAAFITNRVQRQNIRIKFDRFFDRFEPSEDGADAHRVIIKRSVIREKTEELGGGGED